MRYAHLFLIVMFLALPLASAAITIQNASIEQNYRGGDVIRGSLIATFRDVNLDSPVTSTIGGNQSLRSWLNAHGIVSGSSYNCSTSSCVASLSRNDLVTTVPLSSNSAMVGFSIEGQSVIGIDELTLTIQGTSASSCTPQLSVEFNDNSDLTLVSKTYVDEPCFQPNYGCFNPASVSASGAEIPADGQYCERIMLPAAPAYRIGARITNTTGPVSLLNMRLYGASADLLGECTLPALANETDSVSCLVPYSAPRDASYFVCIKAQINSHYTIASEGTQPCGTINFGETYPRDYEIFAQGLKFASPSIVLNGENFLSATGQDLRGVIEQYLQDSYSGACEPYCILPFTIHGPSQNVAFSSAKIIYDLDGAANLQSNSIYKVTPGTVTFSSTPLTLDVAKLGFTVPLGQQPKSFGLRIGSQLVTNQSITVAPSFDFAVGPGIARIGVATNFAVTTTRNVTSVSWDFGDGGVIQTSTGKTTTHRYTQIGTFNLSVEVSDSAGGISRKMLSVTVGDAQASANLTIQEYRDRLNALQANISIYPPWVQTEIKQAVGTDEAATTLDTLARAYSVAEGDEAYVSIIGQVLALKLPQELIVTAAGDLPLEGTIESADLTLVEKLSSRNIENQEAFLSNLAYWNGQHFAGTMHYQTIYARYDTTLEPFFTIVTIDPREIDQVDGAYLVLSVDPVAIKSAEEYDERTLEGGVAYKITPGQVYEFVVLDALSAEDLGPFIAPSEIDALVESSEAPVCKVDNFCDAAAGETADTCSRDCRSYAGVYVGVSLVLLALLAIVLAILWWWYKTRYERSLFPNRNDFLKLINFVRVQKRANVSDKDLKEKLKKAGWTGEQISYVMNKLEHENTAKMQPVKK